MEGTIAKYMKNLKKNLLTPQIEREKIYFFIAAKEQRTGYDADQKGDSSRNEAIICGITFTT